MKPCLLLFPLAVVFAWGASAQTTAIPIFNPLFNLDTLSCTAGNCYFQGITGWLVGPQTFTQKMSTVQYPTAPASGFYVAAIGDSNSTGSILQTLGATVQPNTTYILTVAVGARADYPLTGYWASLLAGNVTLGFSNSATPVGGTFVDDVIVYKSGANPPQLGKPLQIFVKSLGTGQVDVAFVSLTATPN
jgi:hypothetical protein